MKNNKILIFILVLILAFSFVSPAMADEGEGEGKTAPILKYFSAYYELKSQLDCDDPSTPGITEECPPPEDCDDLSTPGITEECPPPEPLDCEGVDAAEAACVFGVTIGTFQEGGLGFGVLANLLLISYESQDCEEPDCNPVTFEELMALYAEGMSLGEIYDTYGSSGSRGVGGLKNAEKLAEKCGEDGSGPPGLCGEKEHGKPESPGKSNKKP